MPREQHGRISPHMLERARGLRKQMTIPEAMLWNVLKRQQVGGLKFRKQSPIEWFVVDFYCPAARLVVEVDGESHVGQAAEDQRRQAVLESLGLTVFRVTNDDVLHHLEAVAQGILQAAQDNMKRLYVGQVK